MEWPGCLRFVLYNISGCVDYITASYTAYKVTSTIVTNSNVCDATMRMDDTASEKSQSSETSRTLVNPEVSQPYLPPVEKQTSDVSSFEFPKGRRRKDKLPAEKSADAALPKPHLLDVSKQTLCSKNVSVAVSLKLMLVSCLALILFPQNFLKQFILGLPGIKQFKQALLQKDLFVMMAQKHTNIQTSTNTLDLPNTIHCVQSNLRPYLPPVEKPSDVSSFEFPKGRRRKDKLPAEKSADAALPKPHLLDVSKQTLCSKTVSVAVSLKLMLVSCLALILFPQNFLK